MMVTAFLSAAGVHSLLHVCVPATIQSPVASEVHGVCRNSCLETADRYSQGAQASDAG